MLGWLKRAKRPEDTPEVETAPAERRLSDRRNVYADVVAMTGSGRFLKKGIALDLSHDGTRLRFENGDSLLDGMVVSIARYGIKRRGIMRWRTRTDVGIEFLEEKD